MSRVEDLRKAMEEAQANLTLAREQEEWAIETQGITTIERLIEAREKAEIVEQEARSKWTQAQIAQAWS